MQEYNARVEIWEPWASPDHCEEEFGVSSVSDVPQGPYDGVIVAVAHQQFRDFGIEAVRGLCAPNAVIYDIKSLYPADATDGRF